MSEWKNARLADVAEIRFSNVDKKTKTGELPVRLCNYMDVYGNGGYITADLPFMEASATCMEIERFRVETGDVIVTKDSETPDDIEISAVVVDEIPGLVCGYHLALVKPNRAKIDSVYLAKQLGSRPIASHFSSLASGSTRYGLSSKSIASTSIPLAPLPQQRRIAKILSTLDGAIEQTEALIAKYQQIKAGLMHDLFTRGVTPDGQLRPSYKQALHLYKESPLGWIPKEWDVRLWGGVTASWAMGPRFAAEAYSENGNLATLRTTDMDTDGTINYSTMPTARLLLDGLRQHVLQPKDFVISRSGTCGVAGVFEGFELPVLPGAFLIRFRFHSSMSPYFLCFYINSPIGAPSVARIAEGGVQKNIRALHCAGS